MQTFTITRGIARRTDKPMKGDIVTFEVDALRISDAKRQADELALAVGWHRGNVDDKPEPAHWAKNITDEYGQKLL